MKYYYIFFLLCSFTTVGFAQEIERVEISGRINVDVKDKEGITVYNQSSNKGTTTNKNGEFSIAVAENDILAFGALQFQDFAIRIDERVIKSRQVSVRLVEQVNKLDEVIILPYDLSGNINVDAKSVRTYNVDMDEVFKGNEDLDDYDFSADNKTKVDDPLFNENRFYNGLNFVNVYKAIFSNKKGKTKIEKRNDRLHITALSERYTAAFYNENFNIPTDLKEAFIEYLEKKGVDRTLLQRKNEIYLIEFLEKESQLFLASRN